MGEIFFTIHQFMVKKLKLKGVERDVFAIIYSFSLDRKSSFFGGAQYLADATGYSKRAVIAALNNLVSQGLIEKELRQNATTLYKVREDLLKNV